jgi:prefoldin subunit 5
MSVGLAMTRPALSSATCDHVLGALEAGAAALRSLEAASASIPAERDELRTSKEHIDRAIELLRDAIAELRLSEEQHSHAGAAGFIMAVRRRRHQCKPPAEPPTAA